MNQNGNKLRGKCEPLKNPFRSKEGRIPFEHLDRG